MKVTKKQAKEFLEKINGDDKVAIIHHDDLDGFASGILFYDYCASKNCKNIKTFAMSLGPKMFDELMDELKSVDKILIADLAPSFLKALTPLKNKLISNIIIHLI